MQLCNRIKKNKNFKIEVNFNRIYKYMHIKMCVKLYLRVIVKKKK